MTFVHFAWPCPSSCIRAFVLLMNVLISFYLHLSLTLHHQLAPDTQGFDSVRVRSCFCHTFCILTKHLHGNKCSICWWYRSEVCYLINLWCGYNFFLSLYVPCLKNRSLWLLEIKNKNQFGLNQTQQWSSSSHWGHFFYNVIAKRKWMLEIELSVWKKSISFRREVTFGFNVLRLVGLLIKDLPGTYSPLSHLMSYCTYSNCMCWLLCFLICVSRLGCFYRTLLLAVCECLTAVDSLVTY